MICSHCHEPLVGSSIQKFTDELTGLRFVFHNLCWLRFIGAVALEFFPLMDRLKDVAEPHNSVDLEYALLVGRLTHKEEALS